MLRFGLAAFFLVFFMSCGKGSYQKYNYDRFVMNTVFQIVIYTDRGQAAADQLAEESYRLIVSLEDKYSAFLSNSVVFQANKNGRIDVLDTETEKLLAEALKVSEETGGAFDITVYPLMRLWGFYSEEYRMPDRTKIRDVLQRVGYSNVILSSNEAVLSNGVQLDLGGLVKGYTVDRVVGLLTQKGVASGIVNAGGNLRIFGLKPDQNPWKIGIRHPRVLGEFYLTNETTNALAISTSGDYEQYFLSGGKRYHHILNPKTGFPVDNGVVSVSVRNASAARADIISTALFVMGVEKGLAYAESNRIAALFILERNGKLWDTNSSEWFKP